MEQNPYIIVKLDWLIDKYADENHGYLPEVILVPIGFFEEHKNKIPYIIKPFIPRPNAPTYFEYRGVILHEVEEVFDCEIFPHWAYYSIEEYLRSRKIERTKVESLVREVENMSVDYEAIAECLKAE